MHIIHAAGPMPDAGDSRDKEGHSLGSGLWAKSGPSHAFVNKMFLAHSHTRSFLRCLWQLMPNGRTEDLQQKLHAPQKLKRLIISSFAEELGLGGWHVSKCNPEQSVISGMRGF